MLEVLETLLVGVASVWAVLTSLGWWRSLRANIRVLNEVPFADQLDAAAPEAWPRLAIVITARDEAETIRPALESLLAQDYPQLSIVLVNDRSGDGTGAIADELAAGDERLTVIHNEVLPEGWLGKVHALHLATETVDADWILFTDADIRFSQGILQKTVAWCEHNERDHLSIMPLQQPRSFFNRVAVAVTRNTILTRNRAWLVGKGGSRRFIGLGAFNLVRKSTFDRTPGFQWLRLEVLDDMGLALMLVDVGARTAIAVSRGSVSLDWYPSVSAMSRGIAKVLLASVRFHGRVLALFGGLMTARAVGPAIGLLPGLPWPVRLFSASAWLTIPVLAIARKVRAGTPLYATLLTPLGMLILAGVAFKVSRQEGSTLRWRGTEYDLEALRLGRRIRRQR